MKKRGIDKKNLEKLLLFLAKTETKKKPEKKIEQSDTDKKVDS